MAILRHKHEIESGRTSSVSHRILAYSPTGAVLNYSRVAQFTPRELAASASKFIRFSDLGGHQRYSKTSLHGLTSTRPDYTMLCICASQGISWVTLDHLAVSLALGVPVFVVITKIDAAEETLLKKIVDEIFIIAGKACVHGGVEVESVDQAIEIATEISSKHSNTSTGTASQSVVPVFCVSCVTGAKLPELHAFLNTLPSSPSSSSSSTSSRLDSTITISSTPTSHIATHFQVDGAMDIAGVGPVFSGVVISGSVAIGDELCVGPDDEGQFRNVVVTGLHRAQVEVERVSENQHATVAVAVAVSRAGAASAIHSNIKCNSPVVVVEYEQDEEDRENGRITTSSSGSDLEINGSALVCEEEDVDVSCAAAAAATAVSPANTEFIPPRYKRQTFHTSQADIELLGKSWDFVRHLTKPYSPGAPHAAAAVANITTSAAAPAAASTSSSSADLSPSDDVDQVSVVPPLRPRKGTVLLGCRNKNKSEQGEEEGVAVVSGYCYFEAVVAMFGETEGAWPGREDTHELSPVSAVIHGEQAQKQQQELKNSGADGGDLLSLSNSPEPTSLSPHHVHPLSITRTRSQRQRDTLPNGPRSAPAHQVMVHCGGVRQVAEVVSSRSFLSNDSNSGIESDSLIGNEWYKAVSGAKAAAAVLQHTTAVEEKKNLIKTACVKFKFSHRPEWVLPGSRVIFRNKVSGKVVGAGVIVTGKKE
jgi:GTPase